MSTVIRNAGDRRLLTIGAVCASLQEEFSDVSISKIRYLEDQGLVTPRRTRGGYRLFSDEDVERLQTILRLQRDEFLPLHVIRQELKAPSERSRRRRGRHSCAREVDSCLKSGTPRKKTPRRRTGSSLPLDHPSKKIGRCAPPRLALRPLLGLKSP